jgi:hypothetical protein
MLCGVGSRHGIFCFSNFNMHGLLQSATIWPLGQLAQSGVEQHMLSCGIQSHEETELKILNTGVSFRDFQLFIIRHTCVIICNRVSKQNFPSLSMNVEK